jgi:hypothetical protein
MFDFDEEDVIQPENINLTNVAGAVAIYGAVTATYGTSVFGSKLKKVFTTQTIGSGFTVSLQFESIGTDPPFSLDAAVLEYSSFDRR